MESGVCYGSTDDDSFESAEELQCGLERVRSRTVHKVRGQWYKERFADDKVFISYCIVSSCVFAADAFG